MPVSVTMPRLGESVTEGTVTRWLKQEGDRVEVDEPLLEVSTDKVDTEIPSPAAGVLSRIVVSEDETAEVGSELAVTGDHREFRADVDGLVLLDDDARQHAAGRGRDLGVDLVGRHLEQWLVGLDALTLGLQPAGDGALGHALAQCGQCY
jgi:pyruvate/2-oxoglutarate dehydrogenase complex dihydrolipoamide acyltransferase (E2) component